MAEETVSIIAILRDRISGPAAAARVQLQGIMGDLAKLKGVLSPLTGQFATFVAGFAGMSGIRRALSEAKNAEEAATRLRSALGENVAKYKEIDELASRIQDTTTNEDDSIKRLAATLLERGVAVVDLQRTINAAVQTAAALGGDVISRGEQIARMYGGIVPREIAMSVHELKGMDAAALRSGAGVDLLIKKYEGRAEALAATDFGKIAQEENKIGDVFEEMGAVFGKLQAIAMPGITKAFRNLVDAMNTPEVSLFLVAITEGIAKLMAYLPQIIAFFLAMKAWGLLTQIVMGLAAGINILIGVIGLILSPVGLITAGIVVLVGVLVELTIGWKTVAGWLSSVVKLFTDVWQSLKDGHITIADLVDYIVASTKAVFRAIKGYTYDPVKLLLDQLWRYMKLSLDLVIKGAMAAGVVTAKGVGDTFLLVVRQIAEALDMITKSAADALSKIPVDAARKLAEAIRTDLASKVPAAVLNQAAEDAKAAAVNASVAMITFMESIPDEWKDLFAGVSGDIDGYFLEADKKATARANERQKKADAEAKKRKDTEVKAAEDAANEKLAVDVRFNDQRSKILANQTDQLVKLQADFELQELENAYARKEIALRDYLAKKQALEGADLQRQLDNEQRALEAIQAKIVASQAQGIKDGNLEQQLNDTLEKRQAILLQIATMKAKQVQDTRDELEAEQRRNESITNDLEVRRLAAANDPVSQQMAEFRRLEIEQEEKLYQLRKQGASEAIIAEEKAVQLLEREVKLREQQVDLAQRYVERTRDTQEAFNHQASETERLLSNGLISEAEADRRNAESLAMLKVNAADAKASLEELLATVDDPEARLKIENQIAGLNESVIDAEERAMDSARRSAEHMRAALQAPVAGFFKDIISGTKSVKDAFAGLVQNIADMMLNIVSSKIATQFLNLLGGGAMGSTGAASGGVFSLGKIFGFASGGLVPGGGPPIDSVPSMLMTREYVQPRAAVDYYGVDVMNAIRARLIPAALLASYHGASVPARMNYAEGGLAQPVAGGGFGGLSAAAVIPDEQTMDALLAGGESAMMRWFGTHASSIKQQLGV